MSKNRKSSIASPGSAVARPVEWHPCGTCGTPWPFPKGPYEQEGIEYACPVCCNAQVAAAQRALEYPRLYPAHQRLLDEYRKAYDLLTAHVNPPGTGSALDALAEHAIGQADATEFRLRLEWWQNHGHDASALYGDDGEMQCKSCQICDYKNATLEDLRAQVDATRLQRMSELLRAASYDPAKPF